MTYIKRRGIIFSPLIFILLVLVLITFYLNTGWSNQSFTISNYLIFDAFIIYLIFGFVLSFIWYPLGKILSPSIGLIITRIYGIGATPFLDRKIKNKKVDLIQFIIRYLNLGISLFALDFLFSNSIYISDGPLPLINGFILSIGLMSLIMPMNFALDDIGLRLYRQGSNQIISATHILNRFVLRFIQTSSLIGSIAVLSILNSSIIENIPVQIRVIFVRNFLIAIVVMYFYTLLFQPKPDTNSWEKKKIPIADLEIKFN